MYGTFSGLLLSIFPVETYAKCVSRLFLDREQSDDAFGSGFPARERKGSFPDRPARPAPCSQKKQRSPARIRGIGPVVSRTKHGVVIDIV